MCAFESSFSEMTQLGIICILDSNVLGPTLDKFPLELDTNMIVTVCSSPGSNIYQT